MWITTHLPTPDGWKAELAWLADTQWTVYPQSGHLLTTDRAQGRESPPAKDQPPNHRATPPEFYWCVKLVIYSCWTVSYSGSARLILALGTFVYSYSTAAMTQYHVQLVRHLWPLVGKCPSSLRVKIPKQWRWMSDVC